MAAFEGSTDCLYLLHQNNDSVSQCDTYGMAALAYAMNGHIIIKIQL